MPFPQTADAMKARGYVWSNDSTCRACGDDIEWWITPRGAKLPMNPMPTGTSPAVVHHATCEG